MKQKKKISNKFNLVLGCLMAVCAVVFFVVAFLKDWDTRLLASGFVTLIWAVVDFYDAFHKSPIEERVSGQADERDVYLAMKSSRTAMGIFNKTLFIVSVLCFWLYARCKMVFLLSVAVTLSGTVLFLFVLLLCVNLYYERRG